MLKAYTFVETKHQKLHGYVLAFFDRIENETCEFSLELFEVEFRPIIERHRKILKDAFCEIYNEVKQWPQKDRT